MEKILELRQKKKEYVDEARSALSQAQAENRSMNSDEQSKFDKAQREVRNITKQIENEEAMLEMDRSFEPNTREQRQDPEQKQNEFRDIGEFIQAVRFQGEKRDSLKMSNGENGGFLVPDQFLDQIMEVQSQDAIFRPRASIIPAGSEPDAGVTFPALDQSGDKGVYSGVSVNWIGEGQEKPQTQPSFRDVTLRPHEVAAHIVVTDKLLRNSQAAGAIIQRLLRNAILASEDSAFLRGDGVAKPLGVIGHKSNVNVNRLAANSIEYPDIVAMYAKMKLGGPMVWITSQETLPQLMTIKDENGRYIWQPNAREGAPGTLLGVPVLINERSPRLGAKGDLILCDLNYYMIKDGSALSIAASEHVKFTENKTIIKAFWNVDGQPWLNSPLKLENGYEVSPFVILDVPTAG
ncbi:phage major capsid protein [Paenalkalicoccus suaedae]|uniref:Phage major capsid protein n=1 Tax=Paenalkalicoccus suaedae TaxID=2592382 RepID=A0A859FFW6_9BACI|nr:phage major capsid protein [Paenalkalicoccus suaedae]QKS71911.1 phage major capsid protein [Paenalkalicoccus suaedae]